MFSNVLKYLCPSKEKKPSHENTGTLVMTGHAKYGYLISKTKSVTKAFVCHDLTH